MRQLARSAGGRRCKCTFHPDAEGWPVPGFERGLVSTPAPSPAGKPGPGPLEGTLWRHTDCTHMKYVLS